MEEGVYRGNGIRLAVAVVCTMLILGQACPQLIFKVGPKLLIHQRVPPRWAPVVG